MKLSTDQLYKTYGARTVVNGVSIEVKQGEIVGLLGPNGAGKTTTFYMIVGFITPDKGTVYLNQDAITSDPMYIRARKGVGYLPQEPSVFRKLSVEDNIKSILEMTKLSKQDQKENWNHCSMSLTLLRYERIWEILYREESAVGLRSQEHWRVRRILFY